MGKVGAQQVEQLVAVQLTRGTRCGSRWRRCRWPCPARNEQQTVLAQRTGESGHRGFLLLQMLERFNDTTRHQRCAPATPGTPRRQLEAQVGAIAVTACGMGDRLLGKCRHPARSAPRLPASICCQNPAAGRVEHVAPACEARGEGVTVRMFVPDFVHALGREVARELHCVGLLMLLRLCGSGCNRQRLPTRGPGRSCRVRARPATVSGASTVSNRRSPSGSRRGRARQLPGSSGRRRKHAVQWQVLCLRPAGLDSGPCRWPVPKTGVRLRARYSRERAGTRPSRGSSAWTRRSSPWATLLTVPSVRCRGAGWDDVELQSGRCGAAAPVGESGCLFALMVGEVSLADRAGLPAASTALAQP